ncbi:hypothetical protein PC129_g6918 [Phytophthora cactorum]|nr:hypothetical protein Pcac1_g5894 [Phytophthora cactorum]KAG2807802.1 hypothetical protein PC112_g17251 [Phytophthora cactorum]KAG2809372.1 hypothetical protein PC111_g16083 [Phytophthora cactorum]KAG2849908.1 hypothetical protein PC113_g17269 [Phytophthora cactorum]KAG2887294.1 hypothetical protein PC114_g18875 [Phytophthora cactorum]
MSSFMRDEYHEWLEWYVEGKKATDTAYESLCRCSGASRIATGSCSELPVASR